MTSARWEEPDWDLPLACRPIPPLGVRFLLPDGFSGHARDNPSDQRRRPQHLSPGYLTQRRLRFTRHTVSSPPVHADVGILP
jgi:hypothetical protein